MRKFLKWMQTRRKQQTATAQQTVIMNATNIGRKPSGIAVYSLNLLRGFAKLEKTIPFIVYLNRNCHDDLKSIEFPPNFTIKWTSRFLSPDYRGLGHGLRLLYANYLALRYRKFTMFNTSQLEAGLFHRRQIVTIHDIIPLQFPLQHRKQNPFFRRLLPKALRAARVIITPSEHNRRLLSSHFPDAAAKIEVIANGKQERPGKPALAAPRDGQPPGILFVGRLCHVKNIRALLAAFELIYNEIPHRLLVVGDDENHLKRLRQERPQLARMEAEGRLTFLGHLPQAELFQLMISAAVFVFPSLYEGFGMPPLEAMSCGCPVIVSNRGSLPEVCDDAALYIDPERPQEIADSIRRVVNDPVLRQLFIRKGIERAAGFHWEKSAAAHLEEIRRQLRSRPGQKLPQLNTNSTSGSSAA